MRKPLYKQRPRIASRGVTKKIKPIPLEIVRRDPEIMMDRLENLIGRLATVTVILEHYTSKPHE